MKLVCNILKQFFDFRYWFQELPYQKCIVKKRKSKRNDEE